jgi:glycerophosphoryl diester phosphodiesterase
VIVQDWLTYKPIAHRGLFDNKSAPENSMRAFELAISFNHPIEFDVRLTKDGKLVVFHDRSLFRMTGRNMRVSGSTWDEIRHIPLLGTDQSMPSLESALEFIKGRTPVLVEIKNEGCSRNIEQKVSKILELYSGLFAVQSFNPFSLRWFKINKPTVCRGQLAAGFSGHPAINSFVDSLIRRTCIYSISAPHLIAMDVRTGDIEFFKKMKKRAKIPLILWTIDSAETRTLCQELGANYIFEQSAMLASP